jgi:hypothetical protein
MQAHRRHSDFLVGGVYAYVQVSYFGIIGLCSPYHDLPIAAFGFSTPL